MAGPSHDPSLYRHRDVIPIRRALVSVSDKTDLLRLAGGTGRAGVEIVSTGSTAATIRDAGFTVTDVAAVTGFPESLGGRVKTLHPGVHAGLLADLRLEDHVQQLAELGIEPFELVVVNLYPFVETVRSAPRATTSSSRSTSADRRWCAHRRRTSRTWRSWSRPSPIRRSSRPFDKAAPRSPNGALSPWQPADPIGTRSAPMWAARPSTKAGGRVRLTAIRGRSAVRGGTSGGVAGVERGGDARLGDRADGQLARLPPTAQRARPSRRAAARRTPGSRRGGR